MAKTKKRQKKDFPKVKVKLGRKLKRANETLPQVKVGFIQIRNQFSDDAEVLSRRKSSKIRELLKLCDNAKTLVRYDGVQQLRQCLLADPTRLSNHFYRIFAHLPLLCIDEDGGIRSGARQLMSWIFSSKEFDRLFDPGDPDLNLVLPYLRLAMNHSQEAVKVDSLALLDVYLTSPRLILFGAVSVLKDLLVLISAQRKSQLDRTKTQFAGRSSRERCRLLASNPVSKLAQQKWRSSVVERLDKLFQVLFQDICVEKSRCEVTAYNNYVDVRSVLSNDSTKQLLTENLIPLLFECWIETGFEKSGSEQMLDHVSISILQNTLKVISSLCSIMMQIEKKDSAFLANFEKSCIQHFHSGFPFKIIQRGSKKYVSGKNVSVSFNISVCHIILRFASIRKSQVSEEFIQKMTSYVITVLEMSHPSLSADLRETVSILVGILSHSKAEDLLENLVNSTLAVISGHIPESDQHISWFDLCSALFVTSSSKNYVQWTFLAKFPSVQKWFASLPDLYLEMGRGGLQNSPKVLELINELIILKQDACREQFTKKLHSYLSSCFLVRIGVSDTCGGAFFRYFGRFFDTVCRASELDLSSLMLLMRACFDEVLPPQDFAYFCDKVTQIFSGPMDDLPVASVNFLQFRNILMNAVVGGFQADLKAACERHRMDVNRVMIYVWQDEPSVLALKHKWGIQREVVQNAIRTMGFLPDNVERLKEVLGFIKSVLETHRALEILHACSLAFAVCCCPHIASPFGPSFEEIGEDLRHPVTDLVFGLVHCIDISIRGRASDELLPLKVLVEVLQLFPPILDEFLLRTCEFFEERNCSQEFATKLTRVLAVLKGNRRMNSVQVETVEGLLHENFD